MWLKRFPPTPPTHSKYEPGACKGTAKHCRWASPNKRIPSVTLLFTSETLFYDRGGKKKKPHRITRDPAVIQFKWGSGLGAFPFFFPSSSPRLVIYCFQKLIPCSSLRVQAAPFVYRSYHVSVNHGHSHVTHRKNTISFPKDRRARVGEETD